MVTGQPANGHDRRKRDGGCMAVSQNVTKREQAAVLLAEDELTDEAIAESVGVQRRTLARWKNEPDFAALVGDRVGQIQAAMLKLAIARKDKRLRVLDDLHTRAVQVVADRAQRHTADLAGPDDAATATRKFFGDSVPPEAATGLLVKQETVNAQGMKTVNWSVDTGLMREIRALHEQAAKELGQWTEKAEIEHSGLVRSIVLEDD